MLFEPVKLRVVQRFSGVGSNKQAYVVKAFVFPWREGGGCLRLWVLKEYSRNYLLVTSPFILATVIMMAFLHAANKEYEI